MSASSESVLINQLFRGKDLKINTNQNLKEVCGKKTALNFSIESLMSCKIQDLKKYLVCV